MLAGIMLNVRILNLFIDKFMQVLFKENLRKTKFNFNWIYAIEIKFYINFIL